LAARLRIDLIKDAQLMSVPLHYGMSGCGMASSLSDLGMIYCGGGKMVHFFDPFRQIATAILLKRSKNCPHFLTRLATIT
jgi:hypothetical protein